MVSGQSSWKPFGACRPQIEVSEQSAVLLGASRCIASGAPAVAVVSVPRHHGVVEPVVGQARVALDSRVSERRVFIPAEREDSLAVSSQRSHPNPVGVTKTAYPLGSWVLMPSQKPNLAEWRGERAGRQTES